MQKMRTKRKKSRAKRKGTKGILLKLWKVETPGSYTPSPHRFWKLIWSRRCKTFRESFELKETTLAIEEQLRNLGSNRDKIAISGPKELGRVIGA
jgi:hypothetical protein